MIEDQLAAGVSESALAAVQAREQTEVEHRAAAYRAHRRAIRWAGR